MDDHELQITDASSRLQPVLSPSPSALAALPDGTEILFVNFGIDSDSTGCFLAPMSPEMREQLEQHEGKVADFVAYLLPDDYMKESPE